MWCNVIRTSDVTGDLNINGSNKYGAWLTRISVGRRLPRVQSVFMSSKSSTNKRRWRPLISCCNNPNASNAITLYGTPVFSAVRSEVIRCYQSNSLNFHAIHYLSAAVSLAEGITAYPAYSDTSWRPMHIPAGYRKWSWMPWGRGSPSQFCI